MSIIQRIRKYRQEKLRIKKMRKIVSEQERYTTASDNPDPYTVAMRTIARTRAIQMRNATQVQQEEIQRMHQEQLRVQTEQQMQQMAMIMNNHLNQ